MKLVPPKEEDTKEKEGTETSPEEKARCSGY
jgi:hypothetical protein